MSADKQRWPADWVWPTARAVVGMLHAACARLEVAGSLRRGRPEVGDIEIVYVPRFDEARLPGEMFAQPEQNLADFAIETLLAAGVLEKRLNANGSEMFGPKNKLLRHVASGIPVDLFATTEECWWNYLVCRTGGAETNKAICNAAIARGWKWNPYGPGFTHRALLEMRAVHSEREVFEFVGLPYLEPEARA